MSNIRKTKILKNETTIIRKSNSGLELKKWIIITLGILLTISALRGGVYRLISFFTVTLLRDFYNVGNFEAGVWTSVILLLGSGTDVYGAYTSDKSGAFGRVSKAPRLAGGCAYFCVRVQREAARHPRDREKAQRGNPLRGERAQSRRASSYHHAAHQC